MQPALRLAIATGAYSPALHAQVCHSIEIEQRRHQLLALGLTADQADEAVEAAQTAARESWPDVRVTTLLDRKIRSVALGTA